MILSTAAAGQLGAQTVAPDPNETSKDTVVLSPFEVRSQKDQGYQATETLAGTRIRTDLKDVGGGLSVYTKEFLADIGAIDNTSLLQYTTNAEVAGTRGTYAGLGNATSVDESSSLRNPGSTNRVRGLAAADNTRDFFVTDIPWDSYNVDRIDIQRGPNSILFGLGSPAGIVNATTRNAEFHDMGSVTARVGSYGSVRGSLDVNQVLVPKTLAIRLDGLWSDEKYQQDPAYQKDKRYYGALRFDPQLFKRNDFHTSFKAKYEHGDIDANRPRTVPPNDSITPWFRPVDTTSLDGGLGKLAIPNAYGVGSAPQNLNPWLTANVANQQQPIWFIDGADNQLQRIYGGYVNTGAHNPDGSVRGIGDLLVGQRYADEFYRLTSLSSYASNARLPGAQYGQYRTKTLSDASVFDFYNNLLDGPTKSEYENWNAYNLDLTQTGWDDRVGVELSYDRQKYKRGGQALITDPTLTIDVLQNFQDLTANPNFGRPYVVGGPGGGTSYESDREYVRGSVFGELRARDFLSSESFLAKLINKQRFNGVYSKEKYETENRTWQMYAYGSDWDAYWSRTTGLSYPFAGSGSRPPVSVIYLGPSLAGASSASGANIPNVGSAVTLPNGNVYHFASTWTNPAGVNYSDPWTVPNNLLPIFDPATATTQASNPANYIGWNSNVPVNLRRYDNGQDPTLLTNAQKSLRETTSYAGTWQGYWWDGAIVSTLGWRYDEVKGKGVTAQKVNTNRSILNIDPSVYALPSSYPAGQIFKDHSTSGGVVVHLNKLFGTHDPLPLNVSVSYNKSANFQVTDTRRDVYGNTIGNPTGKTKDYGVMISTKDDRFSFRAVKYESSVANATTQLDLGGLSSTVAQGLKFRNVFLYKMNGYTLDTGGQTDDTPGKRYYWTPAYVNASNRPVADLNGNPSPVPSGATLETQAQAIARRDASITAWNDIQSWLQAKNYFSAWGYTPTTASALTDRATYEANPSAHQPDGSTVYAYSPSAPQGLAVTADTKSEGYEFEFTANPLPNWRVSFNAAETTAVRTNVGGAQLDELVNYLDGQMAGVAGDMRQYNGNYVPSNEVRQNWANWRGQYTLLKLQEGSAASELRKWRFNVVTNYMFQDGALKGFGVGGAYRWQDRVIIGYPVIPGANGQASFDLSKPYYGPSEDGLDAWCSYEHKLTKRIDWKIQLNIRNVFGKDELIPISVEPDGKTWASARIAPNREWFVTNTFSF
ncbi:TonB-dependent receptor [Horticoccus luteus]|uniref:TonB-dependent receptor n=1 Tax=Horticoccus luteus TaxID=2862869 RepID=A0A8F9TTR5_9BACT|nr:TonB-dependent receptor [Horticoccus luteus]QYM77628.1 TonB-dependent receptor [Horticoccus luteus]